MNAPTLNPITKENQLNTLHGRDTRPRTLAFKQRIHTKLGRMHTEIKPTQGAEGKNHWTMSIHLAATADCTGIANYFSDMTAQRHINIEESYGTRLADTHGSFYLISGKREDLENLIQALLARGDEIHEGYRIHHGKTFELNIIVPDKIGMLRAITGILKEFDINIRNHAIRTSTPPWARLGFPEREGNPDFRSMASINLRLEMLPEIEARTAEIIEHIRAIDPHKDWDIRFDPLS